MERKYGDDDGHLEGAVAEAKPWAEGEKRSSAIPPFPLENIDDQLIEMAKAICERFFKGSDFKNDAVVFIANVLAEHEFEDLSILLRAIEKYSPQKLAIYETFKIAAIFINVGCETKEIDKYLGFLGLPRFDKCPRGLRECIERRMHDLVPIEVELQMAGAACRLIAKEVTATIAQSGVKISPRSKKFGSN